MNDRARTKIIATLGPKTETTAMIKKLFYAGVSVFRINFSHGTFKTHLAKITSIRKIIKEIHRPISILVDTKGPEIRIGQMKNGAQLFKRHTNIKIFTDPASYQHKICDNNELTLSVDISNDLKPNDRILIDDGQLILTVTAIKSKIISAHVFNEHLVKTNKRVNIPGVKLSLVFLSEKDLVDIKFAIKHNADYIALSYVQSLIGFQF